MNGKGEVPFINELTCVPDIDSLTTEWVQLHCGSSRASLLPWYVWNRPSTTTGSWQIFLGRNPASASVDKRVGLFRYFWEIIRMRFSRTRRRVPRAERNLGGYDGRRLPVSQAIRRDCRRCQEAQSADSQSGDDDD